ncbi:hypothetical protein TP40_02425 [Xanthomonas citri pv. citri]|nr:hypothetical protein TP43_16635 [Xanthomonas citri pv. citri]PWF18212.1 hypothetical protein TP40_02425 [Xanthomonas citri pv. citri]QYF47736.1 hypothetical protein HZS93_07297 [Xanthomonas citri]CEE41033.1 hypothetical protein XAC1083_760048 [Xanthomonas citri pv. citri]CEF47291.1 hypothetical protein XAC217_830052 [Xanthomonas citri pv. citri]
MVEHFDVVEHLGACGILGGVDPPPEPLAFEQAEEALTVSYAWLATTLFDTIKQVQDKATRWLWTYNHERPNMALGGITPAMKLAMAA